MDGVYILNFCSSEDLFESGFMLHSPGHKVVFGQGYEDDVCSRGALHDHFNYLTWETNLSLVRHHPDYDRLDDISLPTLNK